MSVFHYPHPCRDSLTVVKPAPFWWHIWPDSWVAKDVGGGRTKCGVRSSAASFACLPSSGTSGLAQHKAALGNILKGCHLPALQLASPGEGGWTRLGGWQAHRGAICLGNCRISVSKQRTSCCDLQLGGVEGGEVGFQRHTCGSSRLLGQGAWQPRAKASGSQAAGQEGGA